MLLSDTADSRSCSVQNIAQLGRGTRDCSVWIVQTPAGCQAVRTGFSQERVHLVSTVLSKDIALSQLVANSVLTDIT